MNARAISFRLDVQQSFMPHISRIQEDIQISSQSTIYQIDSKQFEKLLVQMYNNIAMQVIAIYVSLWSITNGFTCRKHNGNSVIDYVLHSECILSRIHIFSLGEWMLQTNHRTLCIDNRFDCEKAIEDNK